MIFDKSKFKDAVADASDRIFISQMIDRQLFSTENNCFTFSDFMDPYKRSLCLSCLSDRNNFHIGFYGGYEDAERVLAIFFPDESREDFSEEDIPISCIKITGSGKNILTHRDYLGALVGLGITREKFGDIIVSSDMKNTAYVVVKNEVAGYVCQNLRQVGKNNVQCSFTGFDELEKNLSKPVAHSINVASMRVDNVLAAAFKLNRSEVRDLVKEKKVFINWRLCTDADKKVSCSDYITLRGKGRLRIGDIKSVTRKERLVLEVYM